MWPKCIRFAFFASLASSSLSLMLSIAPLRAQNASPASPVASRLTEPINNQRLVTLKGTVHQLARTANDRGSAEPAMPLDRLQLVLKRSDAQEAALRELIQDMHRPGSPSFHKWLTPEEFGRRFGPSDEDVTKISAWLSGQGFTVTKLNPGRQTLEFNGTAGQFAQTFHAEIHQYAVHGEKHFANASDPMIPAALAPVVGGFASLNNFRLKSYAHTLGRARFEPKTHKTTPEWTVGKPGYIPDNILAPGDFAVQYDLNPLYAAGTTGTGQTIGIINEANVDPALVAQYRTLFGLPASQLNVMIDGNDPGIDGVNNPDGPNYASGEAYLDVELSGAVAPAATIDLIISADTFISSGLILAAEHAVYGNVAPVLSLSFGECEAGVNSADNAFINYLWEQAAAQGQTVLVSTGDAGSAGCDNDNAQEYAVYGQQVNALASTPWDVAVGGTDFYYSSYAGTGNAIYAELQQYWNETLSNATPTTGLTKKVPEQPWNDSQYGFNIYNIYNLAGQTLIAGAGGGASNCAYRVQGSGACSGYAKPTWQSGTGVPNDGVRDIPDLSLFAANGLNTSYYPICAVFGDCVTGGPSVQITGIGGTSASTPAFAGMMALVNQMYGPQGQADFVLYPLAKQYPSAFNDVAVGTNTVPCNLSTVTAGGNAFPPTDCIAVANPLTVKDPTFGTSAEGEIGTGTTSEYNAGTGFDLASGLGTVDAANLVNNWNKVTFASSSVTLAPSSTHFAHGTSITISGAVTPSSGTGVVSLETTSTVPLQAAQGTFSLLNGAYSTPVNYLPGGSYTIFGRYSGDGTNGASTSTPVSITVTPEDSTTTLNLNDTTGNVTPSATIPYGTQILLDAVIAPSTVPAGGYGTPTGSVVFADGATTLNTAKVDFTGTAEFNPALAIGPHSLTAAYTGDPSYNGSKSAATALTIVKDTPTVLLSTGSTSGSALTAVSGTSHLSVAIENSANLALQNQTQAYYVNPAAAPTGVVTVTGLRGGTVTFPALASATDPNTLFIAGVANIAFPREANGTYTVTVNYPGDGNYGAANGTFTVTVANPGVTLSNSGAITQTAGVNTGNTSTITVTPFGGFTGSVALSCAVTPTTGTSVPTCTVATPVTITGTTAATATLTVSSTATTSPGAYTVTVTGSGMGTAAASTQVALTENAVVVPPTISLTATPATVSVTRGTPGTSSISVVTTGALEPSGVSLTCAVTPTNETLPPTCSVGPIATSASGSMATLTVNTTGSAALEMPKLRMLPIGGGVAMATLLFFLVPVRRRRWTTLMAAVVLTAIVGFSAGCGSSKPGTTSGTYTVTVTGTGSGAAPATATVTLTVQ